MERRSQQILETNVWGYWEDLDYFWKQGGGVESGDELEPFTGLLKVDDPLAACCPLEPRGDAACMCPTARARGEDGEAAAPRAFSPGFSLLEEALKEAEQSLEAQSKVDPEILNSTVEWSRAVKFSVHNVVEEVVEEQYEKENSQCRHCQLCDYEITYYTFEKRRSRCAGLRKGLFDLLSETYPGVSFTSAVEKEQLLNEMIRHFPHPDQIYRATAKYAADGQGAERDDVSDATFSKLMAECLQKENTQAPKRARKSYEEALGIVNFFKERKKGGRPSSLDRELSHFILDSPKMFKTAVKLCEKYRNKRAAPEKLVDEELDPHRLTIIMNAVQDAKYSRCLHQARDSHYALLKGDPAYRGKVRGDFFNMRHKGLHYTGPKGDRHRVKPEAPKKPGRWSRYGLDDGLG